MFTCNQDGTLTTQWLSKHGESMDYIPPATHSTVCICWYSNKNATVSTQWLIKTWWASWPHSTQNTVPTIHNAYWCHATSEKDLCVKKTFMLRPQDSEVERLILLWPKLNIFTSGHFRSFYYSAVDIEPNWIMVLLKSQELMVTCPT